MIESWRWFGPLDRISISEIGQTGARGIVTSLHEVPYGEVWTREAIATRRAEIEAAPGGLHWAVVESVQVHDAIKKGDGPLDALYGAYRETIANLAAEGVRVICYNFMPILDWTRTRLDAALPTGGTALRFSAVEMAAFEVHMLGRDGAEADYPDAVLAQASDWAKQATEADRERLLSSIMAGLPGYYNRFDIKQLQDILEEWKGITEADVTANLKRFLSEVVPTAEEHGVRLCVHPDDPPRPLLGLPRIVSNATQIAELLGAVDSPANGLTLCSGSLGANPDNDVPAIARRFADRIHFAHLRNVTKEPDGSFQESAHLEGDTDMVALVKVLLDEEARRRAEGRADAEIPFRPDHGHELLSDIGAGTHPGYPMIGRLRGLAELRGVIAGLSHAG
ncbi:mannonate dehydratase [Ponticoccus sp. SC2-23]|uniref:mannonate dehydratase n=1 Tax=Alexandriicola marinus TaxID=2081710 RepID=UPI000FD729E4|nr:mannonate dehydratase [Alexandriicola marinus]MBM1220818.1 mannonate dehydratase [Ponticoccus sp. SC6-9]MBM1225388.1 mannonate dehydratase [Ponticoccus sp. SC6-15]MBM1227571.1 mannonate dehydratase [Ponticoccus sp. SC6-38]MBM1234791.1 mannonate dehydratase [Ponticoccus sp. SC6-45]MBM1238073.1 mannonate dehydratase [Ponticoccus sp. SC6-49]MBM1244294.1 mannonate dehydratase [Ponticoccus sp. SC2-64]MBM1248315.1 mannonate dehydratase [Ponticoccus sp. SC6-42]MBM1252473.1 mannonate dehydratase